VERSGDLIGATVPTVAPILFVGLFPSASVGLKRYMLKYGLFFAG